MVIKLGWLSSHFSSILLVLLEVLTSKVLVMTVLLLLAGFRFRKIVLATVSIVPISEFSIIYMSRAYAQGVVSRNLYLNVLAATAVSMMVGPLLQRIVMSQSRPLVQGRSQGGHGARGAGGGSSSSGGGGGGGGASAAAAEEGAGASFALRELEAAASALLGTASKPDTKMSRQSVAWLASSDRFVDESYGKSGNGISDNDVDENGDASASDDDGLHESGDLMHRRRAPRSSGRS